MIYINKRGYAYNINKECLLRIWYTTENSIWIEHIYPGVDKYSRIIDDIEDTQSQKIAKEFIRWLINVLQIGIDLVDWEHFEERE